MKRTALLMFAALSLALAACDDSGGLAGLEQDPQDLFWKLQLDHHAINLSLDQSKPEYYTHKLVATPLRLDGTPLPSEDLPTFVSSDTNRVKVSADGVLTARAVTAADAPVRVIATLTTGRGPVTNVDTAYVTVTNQVEEVESFSIQPLRSNLGIGYDTIMAARILDSNGDPISGLRVAYSSSLPKVASYSPDGLVMPMTQGKAMLRASMLAYGKEFRDSVELTVGEPEVYHVHVNYYVNEEGKNVMYADPAELTIKAGQGVSWGSATGVLLGIVFDDPTNVGPSPVDGASGNLGLSVGVNGRWIRMFNVPGTYEYTVMGSSAGVTPQKGKIIVTP